MKKVVIFGVAGHTGKYLTHKMQKTPDVKLSVFVRNPAKYGDMDMSDVNMITGDALHAEDMRRAMEGQDIPALFLGRRCADYSEEYRCGAG